MKRDKANGIDIISNLPNSILQEILLRLPGTEEAARTSVLSRRWRYLWTSLPSLDIDISRGPDYPLKAEITEFEGFVSKCLANKTPALESLSLGCYGYSNMSMVWQWVKAAVTRNVKRLDLTLCPRDWDKNKAIMFSPCLSTSESLESLRLFLYGCPFYYPNSIGFSVLKVLELNGVYCFKASFVKNFLKMCPLLEDLSLVNCFIPQSGSVRISCPKLKTLIIREHYRDLNSCFTYTTIEVSCPDLVYFECVGLQVSDIFSNKNVDSLKTVVILPRHIFHRHVVCRLLAQTSHVESLSLNCSSISNACHPEGKNPLSLPNLKTLELTLTDDACNLTLLSEIIRCSPNLGSIHLIVEEGIYNWPKHWELDEALAHRLKRVEFLDFNGDERKLPMACFLLKHGDVLEDMVFSWRDQNEYHENSTETLNEVSNFHKASSTVRLVTLLKK